MWFTTRKKLKYKPAASSQILWSARMVNIKYQRLGKIGWVEEIEIKFGFRNWREDTGGWTGRDLSTDSTGEIVRGYLSLSLPCLHHQIWRLSLWSHLSENQWEVRIQHSHLETINPQLQFQSEWDYWLVLEGRLAGWVTLQYIFA